MSDKKLVFFDIDGTIWDRYNEIPQSTIDAIRQLRANGHLAFLNSGRSRAYIFAEHLLDIGFDGIVSGCGTMVEVDGLVRFYHRIPNDLAVRTIENVRRHGFKPILEGRYNLYMDDDFDNDPFGGKLRRELGNNILSIKKNQGEWEISKISCATEDCDIDACYAEIGGDFDFMVHDPTVVEIVPKGFNKGTGIQKVCEILGADMADTIAFGDSPNDIDMIDMAGIGVVMGDGNDETKEHADHITTGLYEDGIATGLKTLGLI